MTDLVSGEGHLLAQCERRGHVIQPDGEQMHGVRRTGMATRHYSRLPHRKMTRLAQDCGAAPVQLAARLAESIGASKCWSMSRLARKEERHEQDVNGVYDIDSAVNDCLYREYEPKYKNT
jgi:hypothetical protein